MSKGTRNRTVRVGAMWDVAAVIAHQRGETVADVVRRAVDAYIEADLGPLAACTCGRPVITHIDGQRCTVTARP